MNHGTTERPAPPAPRPLAVASDQRAWRGGQRIFVNLLVENEVLCELYPLKKNSCNEMDSARLQAKRGGPLEVKLALDPPRPAQIKPSSPSQGICAGHEAHVIQTLAASCGPPAIAATPRPRVVSSRSRG